MNDPNFLISIAERASRYRDGLADTRVTPSADPEALRRALGGPVPEEPSDPAKVVNRLADVLEAGGLMAMDSGRFFGFVIGGSVPAALGADWLVSAWDQNAGLFAPTPGAAIVEEIAGCWVVEMLGLPSHASFAFVTGGQMANTTALAAARHHVLAKVGWDVEADGLTGAPEIRLIVGDEVHVTIPRGARLLGLGTRRMVRVGVDGNGAMLPDALDPVGPLADIAHRHGAWLHVDGAIGLWAAAVRPSRLPGLERADSWSTDAHKWLNVPYDCGITLCAHPAAHRAAMTVTASYLVQAAPGTDRDPVDWTPEFSRRARALPVYAALASLGRSGVADIVERCCAHAARFAERLGAVPRTQILNDVVLNQVLVRFFAASGDVAAHDARTRAVIAAVQQDGTCWLGGSTWRGQAVMRISVSSAATTTADVDLSIAAILDAARLHQ
jgi:glutamate/tyrosine decarboxylase-like PLP-dependent enzyme